MNKLSTITTDLQAQKVCLTYSDGRTVSLDLYSKEAFQEISHLWVKTGWGLKYSYNFSWLGRPVIQLPEDLLRIQEIIYHIRPDVLVETGIAHGGTSIYYASLFEAMGHGRVISIDIEIRPQNRLAIEEHRLKKRITLIEGSSIAPETVNHVRQLLKQGERAMVVLDSNHTRKHVLTELELYSPMVEAGSYIVATDGVMADLSDTPGGKPEWEDDNPLAAVHEFLVTHPEFEIDATPTASGITYWPDAYLRRR